ncbi:hypothetical protein E0198_002404 [Clavispora lusitaniae]|nr:hypothetical protein E0198_002404 [Clavispora lusitaniae]
MTSSIDTFCLMMSGTMALIQKSLDECTQSADLTCALQQEISMSTHFAVMALAPDWPPDRPLALILLPFIQKIDRYHTVVWSFNSAAAMMFSRRPTHDLANDWFQVYRGDKAYVPTAPVVPLAKMPRFSNALR